MRQEGMFPILEKYVLKKIREGVFVVGKHSVVVPLPEDSDDIYIYRYDNRYRVLVPHPGNPSKKIHVGYFPDMKTARRVRDRFLRELNRKMTKKILSRLKGED